jgi:tagatose 1,6-diphosphate aldolase GatY/KbaY
VRASLDALINSCLVRNSVLPAFTCYNLETAVGAVRAAEDAASPLCILLSNKAFRGRDGDLLCSALVAVTDAAQVPACVQLDHTSDLTRARRALELGAGGLMADGWMLPFEDNVALVREAVELARPYGASVEAELGKVAGDEDASTGAAGGTLTEPAEAERFVAETGVGLLAVAIGNVHGWHVSPPRIDWGRLAAIRRQVPARLTLHGASGLPQDDIGRAIRGGIVKINVNTELRASYFAAVEHALPATKDGLRVLDLNEAAADAVMEIASQWFRRCTFRGAGSDRAQRES